ncbi:MAG: TRAP transporter small permease subunit [Deltaproteobacteria bacterium]|nr:TRAP transporter small permease subunit [Deltaproteobacteria bacterium]MBW1961074.1 TRAP transporter small permease subunit [Deltaproteobacteria bacterium]MBW1994469.1 TRAP transporter small permease subunit [Deltaproteobacteria bacterium]MBW2150509.1 TRAP transporter small permease subunit [Deltaproteobacteria bacterium]
MKEIKAIVKILDNISEWSGKVFSWFIITIIALSLYEVFTRRLLGRPTIWTHEIIAYCFCGAVLLTIGYTLKYRAHANVDIIYENLSPKTQAILDLITYTVFLGIFTVVLLYEGVKFAATSWAMLERTPSAFNFYIFPAKTLLPVGFFLLALQMTSDIIKKVVFLLKGERL